MFDRQLTDAEFIAEAQKVTTECPESWGVLDIKDGADHTEDCPGGCKGTGRVLHPIAQAVYEALTRKCDHWECPDPNRIAIEFASVGKGALAGVLVVVLQAHFSYARRGIFLGAIFSADDPDQAAMQAVLAMLKGA